MHMTETTDTDFLDEGFFPTLIPYKTKQARKFRYNHRILIFEDKIQTREELRTLFMRYNLTFEINFTYEKLIEHLIKTDKIDLIIIDKKLLKNKKSLINTSINFLISVRIPFLYLEGDIEDHRKLYTKVTELLGGINSI